eukprot:UN15511
MVSLSMVVSIVLSNEISGASTVDGACLNPNWGQQDRNSSDDVSESPNTDHWSQFKPTMQEQGYGPGGGETTDGFVKAPTAVADDKIAKVPKGQEEGNMPELT